MRHRGRTLVGLLLLAGSLAGGLAWAQSMNQGRPAANQDRWPFFIAAPSGISTGQSGTLFNTQTTGAADTAVVTTLAGVANTRNFAYKLTARCSAGTASLTVASPAGTTIWSTPAGAVGTSNFTEQWQMGLGADTGVALEITLGTCGLANTGTLIVQAERY